MVWPRASLAAVRPSWRTRRAWLFLLPTFLVVAAVAGWPLVRTLSFAFTDAQLDRLDAADWVGLENFAYLLGDPDWWGSVRNTVVFTVCSVFLELTIGLGIALLLNARFRGRAVLRAVVLIPWAIPTVVSAQIWAWMFHDLYGVFNDLLLSLGLIDAPVAWLADPATSMAAVVVTDVWKTTPFITLLLLAGLQTIPRELYQAAKVDGAGPFMAFFRITLPLLKPAIGVALVFRTLDALRIFDLIYVMTSNSRATATISVYARQQLIDFQEVGFGSAASFLVFVIVGLFSFLYVAGLRVGREEVQ
jgi:trehalose/maltose transport system permease protein